MPVSIESADAKPGKRQDRNPAKKRWYNAPWTNKEDVARQLFEWVRTNELISWPRRFANLTFYRYMTGRPVNPAFHYAVGARPGNISAYYSRVQWQPPILNVLGQCDDVLANRVYRQRPFLQWTPDDSFNQRATAKLLTRWTDGAFNDLKLWGKIEQVGADSRMYGTGWLKVIASPVDDKIHADIVQDDEVIMDESEANVTDQVRTIAIRVFLNREELLDQWGDDPEAKAAIERAPRANLGCYFGADLDTSDVIVLCEGYHLGPNGKPGRAVLAVDGYALSDKKWKRDHFPLAKLLYKRMTGSARGQGMAEQVLGLQREVERFMTAVWENVRRTSWPRILKPVGAQVQDGAFGGKSAGIIPWSGSIEPKFIMPQAISPDQFQYLEDLIRRIRERIGISDQQATVPESTRLRSGIAIDKQATLDDGRHVELSNHLEDFVEEIGVLLVEAGIEAKPSVTLPGRTRQIIKWSSIDIDDVSKLDHLMNCLVRPGRVTEGLASMPAST